MEQQTDSTQEKVAEDFRAKRLAEKAGLSEKLAGFARLEKPYKIQASRDEGEQALAALADTVQLEYVWVFDEKKLEWSYKPILETYGAIDYENGSIKHIVSIPSTLHSPENHDSIFYHIHPATEHSAVAEKQEEPMAKDFLIVNNQLPLKDDIEACLNLMRNGYQGFRLVTPKGVTEVSFHEEKLGDKKELNFTVPATMIYEQLTKGIDSAINTSIDVINTALGGVFSVKYLAFEETE